MEILNSILKNLIKALAVIGFILTISGIDSIINLIVK